MQKALNYTMCHTRQAIARVGMHSVHHTRIPCHSVAGLQLHAIAACCAVQAASRQRCLLLGIAHLLMHGRF